MPENEHKSPLAPGLYLVATPIGNLGDMTQRALDALKSASVVYCEDTRVTGKLLHMLNIEAQLKVYNDHSAPRDQIIKLVKAGKSVALASDAGTPLVSDPGYKLVKACIDEGLYVTSVPGANAALTALQLSGLPSDAFSFIGFLPPKSGARKDVLQKWTRAPGSLIAFETGPRLSASLRDALDALGDRQAAVARELTKRFEEVRRGALSELAAYYQDAGAPKGEIVVVIGPPEIKAFGRDEVAALIAEELEGRSLRDAAQFVAEKTGWPRKDVYNLALELRGK